ncbi:SAF domain-containing protein [Amycolatopsis sp. cmx-11-32]|uniref:SAF domain-containing protein n=1 Tax=Amycolatopsis sp. cmx-11-32 TaxID=2785796 RepID=UPI0039E42FC8
MTTREAAVKPSGTGADQLHRSKRDRSERLLNLAAALIAAVIALVILHGVDLLRDKTVPVLVLASDKAWSATLLETDFATVEMEPAHNAQMIPASEMAEVIGTRLAASLPAGTVLTRRALATGQRAFSGEYLVGLRAERGHRPELGLDPGTIVCVVPVGRTCETVNRSSPGSLTSDSPMRMTPSSWT